MKYNLGDKVRVKSTGRVGEIQSYKEEINFNNGRIEHTKKYYIEFNAYTHSFVLEENLTYAYEYKFDLKFEHGLLDLMIDINLDMGNIPMVKNYAEQKSKLG